MANEITVVAHLTATNGVLPYVHKPPAVSITQNGKGFSSQVLSIGTTEEAVNFGDIATAGIAYLQNVDDTNYVEWGPESGGAMVAIGKLKPGDAPAMFRLKPGVVLRMKANTAACQVMVTVLED